MLSDIEIARQNVMEPVTGIAAKLGLSFSDIDLYGNYKAKLTLPVLKSLQEQAAANPAKLVLVTAITPTPAGEGKSTVSVGLADSLNSIGRRTVLALREPSLGPCFGVKGGAKGRLRPDCSHGRHQPPLHRGHSCGFYYQQSHSLPHRQSHPAGQ